MRGVMAVLVVGLGTVTILAQDRPSADDLARRVQAHYASVASFTARFTQTYEDGIIKLGRAERGEFRLKKPDRFRMVYTEPERKVFVADGRKIYSHFPADKLGRIDPMPKDDETSSALLFLAGRGNLVTDFRATMAPTQPDGEWQLVLTPRRPETEFKTLTLMVDRQSLALRGFSWVDPNGGITTTRFSDLRENVTLRDNEFTLVFPPGTHIER